MALVLNTDTYVTQTDATAYIAKNYITTDAEYINWNALTSDNKDALLRKAAQVIDRQVLTGFKAVSTQTMQFPRTIYTDNGIVGTPYNNSIIGEDWYVQSETPAEVVSAQIEIAAEMTKGTNARAEMQRQGVKSFSLGKLSESYSGTGNSIISFTARELLKPYISGGVRIC